MLELAAMAFVTQEAHDVYETAPESDEVSRVRAGARPPPMSDADREALLLMMKLAERAAVARSFARIAAGMLQESAKNATTLLRAYGHVARAQIEGKTASALDPRLSYVLKVARAAADAAVHVAANEVERIAGDAAKVPDAAETTPSSSG